MRDGARRPHPRPRPRRARPRAAARRTGTRCQLHPARARRSGVVLPSNSPGVHSLWVPAIALKTALVLKPGSAEPWTPYRADPGLHRRRARPPRPSASTRPTTRARARSCAAAAAAWSSATWPPRRPWPSDPRVEVHGPGYSKVVLGPDAAADWRALPRRDGRRRSPRTAGRSCVNASGVWVTAHAREIAEALARAPGRGRAARAEDDPEAQLAPFADAAVARAHLAP